MLGVGYFILSLVPMTESGIRKTEKKQLPDGEITLWSECAVLLTQDINNILAFALKRKYLSLEKTELETPDRVAMEPF
jgi:hypothetical protein